MQNTKKRFSQFFQIENKVYKVQTNKETPDNTYNRHNKINSCTKLGPKNSTDRKGDINEGARLNKLSHQVNKYEHPATKAKIDSRWQRLSRQYGRIIKLNDKPPSRHSANGLKTRTSNKGNKYRNKLPSNKMDSPKTRILSRERHVQNKVRIS